MEKYDSEYTNMSRTKRNQKIYNSTDIGELSRIRTNTNVSVISDAQKEIDIEKIKQYLSSIDNEEKESRRVSLELPKEEPKTVERLEEKDYDINSVLERARGNREVDYEENRYRKINNTQTQIDILKSIKIKEQESQEDDPDITGPIDELNTEEKTIVELIQDIQSHGSKKKDLFEDLMGNEEEETVVMGMADKEDELRDTLLSITRDLEDAIIPDNDFTQEINLEKENLKNSKDDDIDIDDDNTEEDTIDIKIPEDEEDIDDEEKDYENTDTNIDESLTETTPRISTIDKSFYTNSMTFNKSDFEGFEDLESSTSGSFSKIAIVIIVIMLLVTIFLILNFILDWNIFG